MNDPRPNRVALVTGSPRGLGKHIALKLTRDGVRVAKNYHGDAATAAELARHGITVNRVAPGWIPGERHSDVSDADRAAYGDRVPVGHFGKPENVASSVAYFASEEANFVTGESVSMNGGRTIG